MYVYRSTACLYSRWLHGHRTRTKGYISKMSFSKRHISLLIHLLFELWTGSIKSYVWSKINIKCASLFHAVNKGPRRTNKKRWGWVVASGKRESKTEIWWGSRLASQGYPPPQRPWGHLPREAARIRLAPRAGGLLSSCWPESAIGSGNLCGPTRVLKGGELSFPLIK